MRLMLAYIGDSFVQGMPTRSPRSIARSNIFAIVSFGYLIGTFSVLGMPYAAREHWLAVCFYAVLIPPLA
jgi:hypothetical protein